MEFKSYASSSAGNPYTVSDGETMLMLECGLRFSVLSKRLGTALESVSACFITHEHTDHSNAHRELTNRGIPVYASYGTAQALGNELIRKLHPRERVTVGSIKVLPFEVYHDANEPMGFLIRGGDGEKLLFATDTAGIPVTADGVNVLCVECNHDRKLIHGAKPWQKRAAKEHMSIDMLCEYMDKLDRSALRAVYLLHLSDRHSDEAAFIKRIHTRYGVEVVACGK